MKSRLFSPYWLPVWFMMAAILIGSLLLLIPECRSNQAASLSFVDSLFTSTSAMCVTGLAVRDTGSFFSSAGQGVILALIQLGGLGIMTYSSLALYLLGRKVSLTDRISVGQSLLRDPTFSLRRYVGRVIFGTLALELIGGVLLFTMDPTGFSPWSALFHAVSAFCNAGFSLFSNSLVGYRDHWGVNLVVMTLITLGGLGFVVLNECAVVGRRLLRRGPRHIVFGPEMFSFHSRLVLTMSAVLTIGGATIIFLAEWQGGAISASWDKLFLASLFQSVTCRTAGFNTVEVAHLTNLTLLIMLVLMFIGGSPGSTAGGIKTTTARLLIGYVAAQLRGCRQVVIGHNAMSRSTRGKAISLIVLATFVVLLSIVMLEITEGGDMPHHLVRGQFLETLFEVVSAFGTVGLSMGKTASLTSLGKIVIIILMFIGRIGPIWLLTALQDWRPETHYRIPETDLPMG